MIGGRARLSDEPRSVRTTRAGSATDDAFARAVPALAFRLRRARTQGRRSKVADRYVGAEAGPDGDTDPPPGLEAWLGQPVRPARRRATFRIRSRLFGESKRGRRTHRAIQRPVQRRWRSVAATADSQSGPADGLVDRLRREDVRSAIRPDLEGGTRSGDDLWYDRAARIHVVAARDDHEKGAGLHASTCAQFVAAPTQSGCARRGGCNRGRRAFEKLLRFRHSTAKRRGATSSQVRPTRGRSCVDTRVRDQLSTRRARPARPRDWPRARTESLPSSSYETSTRQVGKARRRGSRRPPPRPGGGFGVASRLTLRSRAAI